MNLTALHSSPGKSLHMFPQFQQFWILEIYYSAKNNLPLTKMFSYYIVKQSLTNQVCIPPQYVHIK